MASMFREAVRFAIEFVGVVLLIISATMYRVELGFLVAAVYLFIVANVYITGGTDDAGNRSDDSTN